MTARRIDRILMGLGAFLILISSYQLFFKTADFISGIKLGTLTSTFAVVKTKSALSLDWKDALIGNDLTENQLIYTDNKSSAEVLFNEGNSIEIGENSLVKLTAIDKESGVDLSKGFIRAKIESEKPLKVQMNGQSYVVSGKNADVQIQIQDKKGHIGVLKGEVQVEGAKVSEKLDTKNALEISSDSVTRKDIHFEAKYPSKGETLYFVESPAKINFKWSPQEEGEIILSSTPSMEDVTQTKASALLVPGIYYYKVKSKEGESLVSEFRVVQEKAPEVLRPLQGESVSIMEKEDPKILLQWSDSQRLKYLLQWNNAGERSQIITGSSALVSVDTNAPFKWRIKIQDENRPKALWSEWQEIKLDFIPHPTTPSELSPDGVEYQTYQEPNEQIELSWRENVTVEIEIRDPNEKRIEASTTGVSYEFLAKKTGLYSWRLRAIDSYLRTSKWSEWKSFKIEDLSHEKLNGAQRIQLDKPDQKVTFNWEAKKDALSVFELSRDPDFKTVIKKLELKSDSVPVVVPEVGVYYWRSRQFSEDGAVQISEPKKIIIEPAPAPKKPERLPDLEVPLLEETVHTSMLEQFMNFIIPSAYAEEVRGTVKIELPVRQDAKAYVVRIYRDKKLTDLVFESEIPTKNFQWKNAETGAYFWQYAVIDYWDRKSLFSDPASLVVKEELIPLPEKPRLQSPIRATEVESKDLNFNWSGSKNNSKYIVEISEDKNFKKILQSYESKESRASLKELKLNPKLHYWRVRAFNKKGKEIESNVGRFTILPPIEKKLIVDLPKVWSKEWKKRAFLGWSPSMDTYSFKDGETGKIDGVTIMSAIVMGTYFYKDYVLNAEVIRQTGDVFQDESYFFQRILVDALKVLNKDANHKLAVGLAFAQSSGQTYEIFPADHVRGESIAGLNFGPVARSYLSFNKEWEMQSRVQYLLGDIKQIDLGSDMIRHLKEYFLLGGVSYSLRNYEINSGKQTSLRLTLGIGKEF